MAKLISLIRQVFMTEWRPGSSSGITEYFNGSEPSTFFSEDRE